MNEKHYTYQQNNIFSYLTFLNQRIDIFCTPKISKSLITFLEEKGFPNIILDMRKVIYTDSAGFGLLISILTKCKRNGNQAVIVCRENSLINDLWKIWLRRSSVPIKDTIIGCLGKFRETTIAERE
mgnify:CR=1 FL=1